uniref:Protein-serine/threonine phosphatase n=1 Tax=Heterorhabditis bacteriophora TaxID=37862 RepID=A0A1I7XBY4_HETBA
MSFYEHLKCEFLLDDEDDIEAYERANIESTKDEKEPNDQEMVDTLVKEAGRDVAINLLRDVYTL